MTFLDALAEQRWDDHRYYHHSRINQSLHLVSAIGFLCAYALLFVDPAAAALVGWVFAMPSRQIGHFFFEPRGYDEDNQATHEHKEAIKVGYTLRRKLVLQSVWLWSTLLLLLDQTGLGALAAPTTWFGFVRHVSLMWLVVGIGAVIVRTVQLFVERDMQAGLVWCTKILTDPFHDVKLYYKAPVHLLRGEWLDPIVSHRTA
jgi:hypothetical protein